MIASMPAVQQDILAHAAPIALESTWAQDPHALARRTTRPRFAL
jgi:hypothetical protein